MKMPKGQRFLWLLLYIERANKVSALDMEFVYDYLVSTGLRGTSFSSQLLMDLGEMCRLGYLSRTPISLPAIRPGFPGWTNVYELAPFGRAHLETQEESA